jgi:colanic acid biosynthesis glycosyl transferase WcaI
MPAGFQRTTLILLHDVLVAGLSFMLAFWLSNGGHWLQMEFQPLAYGLPASLLIAAACFHACGLHRRVWSYTSLADLISIARTSTWVILLLFFVIVFILYRRAEISGAAPIIQWFVMIVLLSASRLAYRAIKDGGLSLRALRTAQEKVPVLVYGDGPLAPLFIRAAQSTSEVGLHVVGIVDDNDDRRGRYFNSIPVLGRVADLQRILVGLAVQGVHPRKIVVTRAPGEIAQEARAAMDAATWRHGLKIEYLPNLLNIGAAVAVPLGAGRSHAPLTYFRLRRVIDIVASTSAILHDRASQALSPGVADPWPGRSTRAEQQPRLLIVNRYFHPDRSATSQLLTDLVETAVKQGFATTVFASRQLYNEPGASLPLRQDHLGAEVRRLWATRSGRLCLPGRALDYATFCGSAFGALLAAARPGDVILAKTDPPLISVVAWAVARIKGAKLVNWCQDLFPEAAAAVGFGVAAGTSGRVLRALRNASLRGAAMNVAVCEGMAERLRAEGIPADRVTVIHNWADGSQVRPLAREHNRLRRQWGLGERFVIGYSGNLGRMHDVETLIELMDALGDEPEMVFLLIGAGAGYERLKRRAARRGLGNVMLRPHQPMAALRESLAVPDLHIVSLRPECEGLVMPSKLYGALAAGRPVIAMGAPAGDVARIVRAHDAGLVVAPGGALAAAAAIRALRAEPLRLAQMGANARRAYERRYSREASLAAWTDCLRVAQPAEHPVLQNVAAE